MAIENSAGRKGFLELAVFNWYKCIHHDLHVVFGEMQNFIFLADFVCSRLSHEKVWHRHKIPPTTPKESQFTCCFECLIGTPLHSFFVRTCMAPPLICGHLVIQFHVRLTVYTGVFFPLAVVLPKQIGEIEGTSGFILIDDLVYFVSLTDTSNNSKGFVEAPFYCFQSTVAWMLSWFRSLGCLLAEVQFQHFDNFCG